MSADEHPGHRARRGWRVLALLALVCGALAWAPLAAFQASEPNASEAARLARIVVVVRHGEKDPAHDARDPGLSDAGVARAQALARTLRSSGVTHLFASEYRRTQATLAPLAQASGRSVTVVPAAEGDRLIAAIEALPGGSVCVVAAHSNTVPKIVAALGGRIERLTSSAQGPTLSEGEYERLFVLTLPPASARATCATATVELAYGD